jgi:hypothetical protein
MHGVHLPKYRFSLQLPKLEHRCKEHMNYLRCSCCKGLFDGLKATVNQQYGYPCILCETHSNERRCHICHKWKSKSRSLNNGRCQGHGKENGKEHGQRIFHKIEQPKSLKIDTQLSLEDIEHQRIAKARYGPRRHSLRGQLLRDLAYRSMSKRDFIKSSNHSILRNSEEDEMADGASEIRRIIAEATRENAKLYATVSPSACSK